MVRSLLWEEMAARRVPRRRSFFLSLKPDDFPTADFHQIWLRYVNPCPLANHRKRFSKIFRLRVTCLQKPQPKGRTAERVFTPRCSPRVRQCPNSGHFRSLYGLWDIKFSNFPFFCLFLPIKRLKCFFCTRPTAQELHCRMLPVIQRSGGRDKVMPFASGIFCDV